MQQLPRLLRASLNCTQGQGLWQLHPHPYRLRCNGMKNLPLMRHPNEEWGRTKGARWKRQHLSQSFSYDLDPTSARRISSNGCCSHSQAACYTGRATSACSGHEMSHPSKPCRSESSPHFVSRAQQRASTVEMTATSELTRPRCSQNHQAPSSSSCLRPGAAPAARWKSQRDSIEHTRRLGGRTRSSGQLSRQNESCCLSPCHTSGEMASQSRCGFKPNIHEDDEILLMEWLTQDLGILTKFCHDDRSPAKCKRISSTMIEIRRSS